MEWCEEDVEKLEQFIEELESSELEGDKRAFVAALNRISMYKMTYDLPLRQDAYNDLINSHPELRDRSRVLLVRDVDPVEEGRNEDVVAEDESVQQVLQEAYRDE